MGKSKEGGMGEVRGGVVYVVEDDEIEVGNSHVSGSLDFFFL